MKRLFRCNSILLGIAFGLTDPEGLTLPGLTVFIQVTRVLKQMKLTEDYAIYNPEYLGVNRARLTFLTFFRFRGGFYLSGHMEIEKKKSLILRFRN